MPPVIRFISLIAKIELYKESDVWAAIQRVVSGIASHPSSV